MPGFQSWRWEERKSEDFTPDFQPPTSDFLIILAVVMKNCPQCGTALPQEARFCFNCGASQQPTIGEGGPGGIHWSGDLLPQFMDRFWLRLDERVKAEQNAKELAAYKERVYESGFRETAHRRLEQLVVRCQQNLEKEKEKEHMQKTLLRDLQWLLDDLLDFFFVMYAQELNVIPLPEQVLGYQGKSKGEIDLRQMGAAFLAFAEENVRVYTDLVQAPVKVLRNSAKTFLNPEHEELIWFICDLSLLGNGKEGFAMTDQALYWKSGWQPAQKVFYHKLSSLQREKEWILVNDIYFNATPRLNTKMIWLLRKLARLDLA